MSLADEILTLLDESDKLIEEFNALDERTAKVFEDLEQDALKEEFLSSVSADLNEDTVESLMRAQERISELVKARIRQKIESE
jgi:hypothetical protein